MWLDDCLAAEEYFKTTNPLHPRLNACMDEKTRELIGSRDDFLNLQSFLKMTITDTFGGIPSRTIHIVEVGTPGGHQILAEHVECYYLINDYLGEQK